jgi:flagella basal body P-ring formation protein FlgA
LTVRNSQLILALLLLLFAVVIARGGSDPATEMARLRAQARCGATEFRLGELFEAGLPPSVAERVLGKSPAPGQERLISRNRLERILADWGWRGHLEGPRQVRVFTPAVKLATAPIVSSVSARLDSLLRSVGLELGGELRDLPEHILLSCASIRWELKLGDVGRQRTGQVQLIIEDRGGFISRHTLRFPCRKPGPVAVARRDMSPGETIQDWGLAEMDLFSVRGKPLPTSAMSGAITKRGVRRGQALTEANAKPAPLVCAGGEVDIRLNRGAVQVSLRGVSRSDGALGDLVSVRHLDTRHIKRYRVTGPGTVAPAYLKSARSRS